MVFRSKNVKTRAKRIHEKLGLTALIRNGANGDEPLPAN